ncbi:TRAP transporter large permease [Tianweitania sp. BSSL-BM11]|uniref:TRAP transporter large permease protein n=1 Tax=Tianweitania aestuarii TaxID=2814886 RepID=A0ABS5RYP0_9HYPH|nr:TRAP transporter large permease [Tianweitania aestuarii]MBS9722168.1 TRAP transporter large permease [Tianweitania aestuarii]
MGSFFGAFVVLLATGVPISLALGVGGMAYLFLSGHGALILAFPQRMMAGVDQFILLTIPLFLLAGTLMNVGGITDRIVQFARAMVGHRRGGMSSVTVLSAGFFAGISGSATAEASALGSILIPAMKKQGIPPAYAAALVGVSSIVGPIIPPSITMIVYGVLSGASIGQLFIAGVTPGILILGGLLLYSTWRAKRDGFTITPKMAWNERRTATMRTLPALILPLIIIVGIKAGIFTPTEAAAVAVIYALIIGFAYRDLTLERVWDAMIATALASSSILFITAMASIVAFVLTLEQVPTTIASGVLSISDNPIVVLVLLNLVLLVLGMFLEPISILILTMPILMQFMKIIGMDPVQFGTMVVLNVVIGMATPPVGILLFIVCAASGQPLSAVAKEAIPLIGICLLVLALVAALPGLTLWLPHAMLPVN